MVRGRDGRTARKPRPSPPRRARREPRARLDGGGQRAAARAGTGDSPDFRRQALELLDAAVGSSDPATSARKLTDLGALLREGVESDQALEALADAAERLARRQEKAWGIKLDAAQAINARELVAVLSLFADVVLQEAPADVAARIVRRIDTDVLGTGSPAARIAAGLGD